MAEQQNGRMVERQNGRMEEWRNGGIAKNGGMAGMATYLLHLWYMPTPTPFDLL
jgi:hypothetical protein